MSNCQPPEIHITKTYPESTGKRFFEIQETSELDFFFFFFCCFHCDIWKFRCDINDLWEWTGQRLTNGSQLRCSRKQQAKGSSRVCQEFRCLICCLVKSPGSMPCSNLFFITCSWSYFWVGQQSYTVLFVTDLIKIILVQDLVMFSLGKVFAWAETGVTWRPQWHISALLCHLIPDSGD